MNYYHISAIPLSNTLLRPRIPESIIDGFEDNKTKRVCFSTSIAGCIRAVTCCNYPWFSEEFYVYNPINYTGRIIKPSEEQVCDVKSTREKWFTSKVRLKCIGKIRAYGINLLEDREVKWYWIKKY